MTVRNFFIALAMQLIFETDINLLLAVLFAAPFTLLLLGGN
jgi:hypothetical protein